MSEDLGGCDGAGEFGADIGVAGDFAQKGGFPLEEDFRACFADDESDKSPSGGPEDGEDPEGLAPAGGGGADKRAD